VTPTSAASRPTHPARWRRAAVSASSLRTSATSLPFPSSRSTSWNTWNPPGPRTGREISPGSSANRTPSTSGGSWPRVSTPSPPPAAALGATLASADTRSHGSPASSRASASRAASTVRNTICRARTRSGEGTSRRRATSAATASGGGDGAGPHSRSRSRRTSASRPSSPADAAIPRERAAASTTSSSRNWSSSWTATASDTAGHGAPVWRESHRWNRSTGTARPPTVAIPPGRREHPPAGTDATHSITAAHTTVRTGRA